MERQQLRWDQERYKGGQFRQVCAQFKNKITRALDRVVCPIADGDRCGAEFLHLAEHSRFRLHPAFTEKKSEARFRCNYGLWPVTEFQRVKDLRVRAGH